MSNSNIIIRAQYKNCNNLKHNVAKTISYISDKKKADSSIIDEYDSLRDYLQFTNNDSFLFEDKESFVWSINGDIDAKKDLKNNLENNSNGVLWSLVISFQPDFAINNGLITKVDYYNLTKNIMPTFLLGMGFKLDNVSWYCSLHRNTDNPHLHICIYEHNQTIPASKIPYSLLHQLKSNIANFLVDNKDFYTLRDNEFKSITGSVSLKELTKIKGQKLFSDKYRLELNRMLLSLYSKLPPKGRLQYNSKSMLDYKDELNNIIEYILMHDSVKYKYSEYLKLLDRHQKELKDMYGSSISNKNNDYYNNQVNKLFSKIGNEILNNYKIYRSSDFMEKEKDFLKKHINEFNFKSRNYALDQTKINIGKGLYKLCQNAGLNYNQSKDVFIKWLSNSHYKIKVETMLPLVESLNNELSITDYYNIMNKLGYDYNKLNKFKEKRFYQQLNYKLFIDQAIKHLEYELELEEKQIINEIEHELDIV